MDRMRELCRKRFKDVHPLARNASMINISLEKNVRNEGCY